MFLTFFIKTQAQNVPIELEVFPYLFKGRICNHLLLIYTPNEIFSIQNPQIIQMHRSRD